jgi:succinoglycan biosynthesis transport protein ExoP
MTTGAVAPAASATRRGLLDECLASLLRPTSFEAERYRVLRHAVETLRKDTQLQVVAVTSPGTADGKTTTAINLAGALAQAPGARVLLADVDLRRPALTRQLGLEDRRPGVLDVLLQPEVALPDGVRRLAQFNLSVLPAGVGPVAPYEALKLPRFEELLEEARQRYDYVVLDTPPFVPVPDGRLIAGCVDGFLVVVAAHRTPRKELAEALGLMDPAKVVGLVFNGDDAPIPPYYSRYTDPRRRDGSPWRYRRASHERRPQREDSSSSTASRT